MVLANIMDKPVIGQALRSSLATNAGLQLSCLSVGVSANKYEGVGDQGDDTYSFSGAESYQTVNENEARWGSNHREGFSVGMLTDSPVRSMCCESGIRVC